MLSLIFPLVLVVAGPNEDLVDRLDRDPDRVVVHWPPPHGSPTQMISSARLALVVSNSTTFDSISNIIYRFLNKVMVIFQMQKKNKSLAKLVS